MCMARHGISKAKIFVDFQFYQYAYIVRDLDIF